MGCPGLHCACCSGGLAVPPIAFVYAYGAAWVAEHLVEVAITSAACGVLAVAAVVALMRWQDRRQARFAAQASIWTVRAGVLPPEIPTPREDLLASRSVSQLSDFALETGTGVPVSLGLSRTPVRDSGPVSRTRLRDTGPAEVHLHFHGWLETEQAEVIRRALET